MRVRDAIAHRAAGSEHARAATAPSGLAARIRAARTLRRAIQWPGTDIPIGIRILSRGELAEAQVAAAAAVKERGLEEGKLASAERVMAEYIVQLLARALYESADPLAPRLFATAQDLDAEATLDEINALFGSYEDLRQEVDPELEELPEEVWKEFLDAVKKKEPTSWNAIASSMPRPWLRSLAIRLASSLASTLPSTESSSEPHTPSDSASEGDEESESSRK